MLAFILTVGTRVPIQPTTLSYTPGVRTLVVMLAFGACALYPVGRVSMATGYWSPARVALDGLMMSALYTVLFWPMQLVTYWSRATGLTLWVLVLGWIWVAVGMVALTLTLRSKPVRVALTMACPAVLAMGALLDTLQAPSPWPALMGPAVAVLDTAPRNTWSAPQAGLAVAVFPWCMAALLWAVTLRRAHRTFAHAAWAG